MLLRKIKTSLLIIPAFLIVLTGCTNNQGRLLSIFENVKTSTTFIKKPIRYLTCKKRIRKLKYSAVIFLAYHNVLPVQKTDDLYVVSVKNFNDQLLWLNKFFLVLSIEDIEYTNKFPGLMVIITFDDGALNNYADACPALVKTGLPATFFVITDFVGTKDYAGWDELSQMQARGMSICSHSRTHPDFGILSRDQARQELFDSRAKLKSMIPGASDYFAYPFGNPGNMQERDRELIDSAGYRLAFAYGGGAISSITDKHRVPRYMVVDIQGVTLVEQLLDEFEKLAQKK